MSFKLSDLPNAYDALEPYIDARTMEIHHDKHYKAYTDNLNKALEGTEAAHASIEEILKNISQYSTAVRNNGGGYYNHTLFWKMMSPKGGGEPQGKVLNAINSAFGSFIEFKNKFSAAAATRFGSGWAWLILDPSENLKVVSTPNQDNTLMDISENKGTPLLGLDVWEHAYYLKYQNRRPDYISEWWNIVNWDEVAKRMEGGD